VGGSIKNIIRRVIRRHLSGVRNCYRKVRFKHPKAKGRIVARFMIAASGRVSNIKFPRSSFKSPVRKRLATCLSRVIIRWRFPKPKKGVVVVSYPFVFRPR
jgi:outer membrane biosynthesis protein TonB